MSLKPNDVEGAVEAFRTAVMNGEWTPELSHVLLGMQDDPRALMARFAEVTQEPEIAAALEEARKRIAQERSILRR